MAEPGSGTEVRHPVRGVVAGLCAVVALATGCSGGDAPAAKRNASAAPSASGSAAAPILRDAVSALPNLSLTACPSGRGRLKATGDLDNHGRAPADYVVTVSWLGADGGVLGSAYDVLEDVAAGQQEPWHASADLSQVATGCTTRVSRGTLP